MLPPVPRRVLALVLMLAMVPAISEILELAVHAVVFGDVAHHSETEDADHEETPLGTDEHGCSPVMHLCGCHAPTPCIAESKISMPESRRTIERALMSSFRGADGIESPAPPTRPPIA